MSAFTIICISFLSVVIISLAIFIIKSLVMPKKASAIPKLIKQGRTQNAIKLAKQIILKEPKNYLAHYYLGKCYLKDNKSELALLEYQLVNECAVFGEVINEVDFKKEYGQLLLKHHKSAEALKNYLLLTQMDPKNAENYFIVGSIYKDAGKTDTALGYFKKAVALDKRHAKAHGELGLILFKLKQLNEAKNEINLAIRLNPEAYSSYYYLGKIQKEEKDYLAALKNFEKAQRDPEFKLKSIIEHGSCYMMYNRLDNAAVDFQRAIELDKAGTQPETLYARYFLASCYEKNRKLDLAIEQWTFIYNKNKNFRDVSAKLSEYKDLNANDFLKDYLTCGNEEFALICKNAADKALKMEILSCETKKWGCAMTAVEKREETWMAVRKQVSLVCFYREPEPLEDRVIQGIVESLKRANCQKALVLSSSGFSLQAKRYAESRSVELIDKAKLESLLTAAGAK